MTSEPWELGTSLSSRHWPVFYVYCLSDSSFSPRTVYCEPDQQPTTQFCFITRGRWQEESRHVVGSCWQTWILLGSSGEEIWRAIHLSGAQYVCKCLLVVFRGDIQLSTFRRSSFINDSLNLCEYEQIIPIAEVLTSLCRQGKPQKHKQSSGTVSLLENKCSQEQRELQAQPFLMVSREFSAKPGWWLLADMGSLPAF